MVDVGAVELGAREGLAAARLLERAGRSELGVLRSTGEVGVEGRACAREVLTRELAEADLDLGQLVEAVRGLDLLVLGDGAIPVPITAQLLATVKDDLVGRALVVELDDLVHVALDGLVVTQNDLDGVVLTNNII